MSQEKCEDLAKVTDSDDATSTAAVAGSSSLERASRIYKAGNSGQVAIFERSITVIVGPAKQRFVIHEHLARTYSEYFKVALDGRWKEAESGTFELVEENTSVFAGFVSFLYNQSICCHQWTTETDEEVFLIESYLLGERRGSVAYRNAAINALQALWTDGKLPTFDAIMLAFRESMEHSKLRQLIVDKCAWEGSTAMLLVELTVRDAMLPGSGLELSLALLKRVDSAAAPAQCNACTARTATALNASTDHVCQCHTTFKELSLGPKKQCGGPYGPSQHSCQYCGLRFAAWHEVEERGPQLILVSEAPYNKRFCAEYHEHEDGICCKSGESSCDIR